MKKNDPYNLQRFLVSQERDDTYWVALAELRAGKKVSHWIWFVLPRLIGEGYSTMSTYYAISNRWEARAYIHHPTLGARLWCCVEAILQKHDKTLLEIFGPVDEPKVRQCAALFASLNGADPIFSKLLHKS